MRRARTIVAAFGVGLSAVALSAGILGCGGGSGQSNHSPVHSGSEAGAAKERDSPAARGFAIGKLDKHSVTSVYGWTRTTCGNVPVAALAEQYRARAVSSSEIARAVAQAFPPSTRQAAEAGCRRGLE